MLVKLLFVSLLRLASFPDTAVVRARYCVPRYSCEKLSRKLRKVVKTVAKNCQKSCEKLSDKLRKVVKKRCEKVVKKL